MTFLTIEEAINNSGKSESTIRRLIRAMSASEQKKHLKKERLANGGYKYRISQSFLEEKYGKVKVVQEKVKPKSKTKTKPKTLSNLTSGSIANLDIAQQYIESLERQLRVKDNQLLEKDKQISDLIDRDRESNLLLDKINDALIKYRIPEMLEAQTISFDESETESVSDNEPLPKEKEDEVKDKKKKKSSKKALKKKEKKELAQNHKPLNDDDNAPFSKWLNHLS
jgi:hypothetical protein